MNPLRWILVFLFIILTPLFILLLSIRLSGFSPTLIKETLEKGNAYRTLVNEIETTLKESKDEGAREVLPFFKSYITPEYLQAKTEKLVDDTDSWVKGKSLAPVISFTEIKKSIPASLLTELSSLSKELEKQSPEEAGQFQKELDAFVKNDFSFPVGDYLGGVKTLYQLQRGLPIIGLILALLVAALYYLTPTTPERLKIFTIVFGLALLSVLPGFLLLLFLRTFLTTTYPTFEILVGEVGKRIMNVWVFALVTLLGLAAGSLIGYRRVKR